MERKFIEVEEESKSKKNSKGKKKVDLKKVAKVIVDNKETIATVATTIGTLIETNNKKSTKKKTTTSKKSTGTKKKTTTSKKKSTKSDDAVSTLVDLFLK